MHKTVLLEETIDNLNIKEDGIYVDATLGFGGHSSLILKRIKRGFLFAFDQDIVAINYSLEKLSKISNNFEIIKANFSKLKEELEKRNVTKVNGLVFDLGVSSLQLDTAARGFSYHRDAKLDMRMDTDASLSAYNVVNEYPYEKLVKILRDYGEEKYASNIARNIVRRREKKEIVTTFELVDIIKSSMPMKAMRDSHPARKTFQAIRIEVNRELEVLKTALDSAFEMLEVGGRIAVITFHSLEDKIVKEKFYSHSKLDDNLIRLPFVPEEYLPKFKIVATIFPTDKEISENNRSRSAKLRIIERIKEG